MDSTRAEEFDRDVFEWAARYNGYTRISGSPERLITVLRPLVEVYDRDGEIPEWAGIDLLRGWAFYLAREWRFCGYGRPFTEDYPQVRDIAAAVNARSDATAEDVCLALPGFERRYATDATGIFTTEPMITRALAAEIRHDPKRLLGRLARDLPDDVAFLEVERVECESTARLDIVLHLDEGQTIGIEAKLDHELSDAQMSKQLRAVDYLFLLVLDKDDAGVYEEHVQGVLTWTEVISCFTAPRLRLDDIEAVPIQKVSVERMLRPLAQSLGEQFGPEWKVAVGRGGSGMSAITVWSPHLPDSRRLRGQIQVVGRGMPTNSEDLEFEFHVGIETRPTTADFPAADTADVAPGWLNHLIVLRDEVIRGDLARFRLRQGRAGNGRQGVGNNKLPLVKKFLPDDPWLAQGYFDWSLGPKSEPATPDELESLASCAHQLFVQWYSASTNAD